MVSLPKIVAFCGPKTVGKSTASKVLLELGYKRLSFADPIRDMLRAIGVSERYLTLDKEEPCPELEHRTARYALQTLGTQWGRDLIGENFWVHLAARRMASSTTPLVIDDARFDNEALAIKDAGGILIEVARPGVHYNPLIASEAGISPAFFTARLYAESAKELEDKVRRFFQ